MDLYILKQGNVLIVINNMSFTRELRKKHQLFQTNKSILLDLMYKTADLLPYFKIKYGTADLH